MPSIVDSAKIRPVSQRKRRWPLVVFAVVALVALVALGYRVIVPREDRFVLTSWDSAVVTATEFVRSGEGSGTITFPKSITLVSSQEGYVGRLAVSEGDTVAAGDFLLTLEVPDLEDDLEDIDFALINNRASRMTTEEEQRIDVARTEREIARMGDDVEEAAADVERIRQLVDIGAKTASELDDGEETLLELEDDLNETVLQLEENRRLYALNLESIDMTIREYETLRDRTIEEMAESTVSAPFDGMVMEIANIATVAGSQVDKGTELITIADPSSAVVELEVDESDSSYITPGQEIDLTISGNAFPGTVLSVGTTAELSDGSLEATVVVTVKPDTGGATLLEGATATGTFTLDAREDTLVIPRGPYLSTGSQRWIYRIVGDHAERVPVVFGEIQATQVEITSGLSEGDEVITSGYQNYIDFEQIILEEK